MKKRRTKRVRAVMGICVSHRPRVYILFFLLSEIKAAFRKGDKEVEKLNFGYSCGVLLYMFVLTNL